jgi:murein DD-endopeptidase MepM/ murein hydrolase activator NlpD
MKNTRNIKGQIFIVSVIIAVTAALMMSYVLLRYLYEPKNENEFLGSYQSGIIDAMADGDKVVLYVDQAARMSAIKSIEEYTRGTSAVADKSLDSSTEGITVDEINDRKNCGNYVYRLWNNENMNCYPEYTDSKNFELNPLLDKYLKETLYQETDNEDPLYLNNILKQTIKYDYTYEANFDHTKILGFTNDKYNIAIFRDAETKKDSNIQQYLTNKDAYSGELIWPLKEEYKVTSCFGFRGVIKAGAGIKATVNHGGIDIGAPLNTPVYAAAPGIIVSPLLFPEWGIVTIDHSNGLKTSYTHMNSVDVKIGDRVTQGQQIGSVGGRSGIKENTHYPNNGDYNNYAPHLHFSVISSTVDPNTNYEGIKAVVISKSGEKLVNPLCFIDSNEITRVEPSTDALVCNSICYQEGGNYNQDMNTVKCTCGGIDKYKKAECAITKDLKSTAPFKFCDVYQGVVVKEKPCMSDENSKWKVNNILLSETSLTSDNTLKITFSVINEGDGCVAIYTQPTFITEEGNKYLIDTKKSTNVYKTKDKTTPTNLNVLSCTFSSDVSIVEKARAEGKCVLLAPSDNKILTYTIYPEDIFKDDKDKLEDYTVSELKFTVKKGTGVSSNIDNEIEPSNIILTPNEQLEIDKTRENLEKLKLREYIDKITVENEVPTEIIYGIITVESRGNLNADSGDANGLMQITEKTYNDKSFDFQGKCSWEEYLTNKECQILAGVMYLKQMHNQIGSKTVYYQCNKNCRGERVIADKIVEGYWPTCTNAGGCSPTDCLNPVNKKYVDWEAALRRYNGGGDYAPPKEGEQTSGCINHPDYEYVEKVIKYAVGWGYRGAYGSMIQDEANKGILGKYTIAPTFSINVNFDIRLLDKLKEFADNTVKTCGVEGENKKECVENSIKDFNDKLLPEYKERKVKLDTTCDENNKIDAVNQFVEEINDCMLSSDTSCQCHISLSPRIISETKNVEGSTLIKYVSDSALKEVYVDYKINTIDDTPAITKKAINDIKLYKNQEGNLYTGIRDPMNPSANKCSVTKNRFTFCLQTKYEYIVYDPNYDKKIKTQTFTVPFALLIRDQTPPAAVSGISANNLTHAKNTIALQWDQNTEKDVVKYNIYLADDKNLFEKETVYLKDFMNVISISNDPTSYEEYKEIDLSKSACELPNIENPDYCIFKYSAKDKTDTAVNIELKPGKVYYLSDSKKFMYILSDADSRIKLTTGQEKIIGITAVDIDGNELKNDGDGTEFKLEKNLIRIIPEDNLEVGLTRINSATIDDTNKEVKISWDPVVQYIDGTEIIDNPEITYSLYMIPNTGTCSMNLNPISQVESGLVQKYTQTENNVDISQRSVGSYCLGVSATSVGGTYSELFLYSLTKAKP